MNFEDEPPHSSKLIAHSEHPWNAEPPLSVLIEHPITPEELVYCRNHGPVKPLDVETFVVKLNGLYVEKKTKYTLLDICTNFPVTEVVAALQCAGNRRKAMQDKKNKEVEGLLWGEGTICNVRWGGVPLRDLLLRAGVRALEQPADLRVCFASHVTVCQEDEWFGASIPLVKVMDKDGGVLLAYMMNGRLLSPDHGRPFRIVIPGYSGARWVKWVDQIDVSQRESENYYQQKDYKVLPPQIQTHDMADAESWWSKVPPVQSTPLNSVVAIAKLTKSGLHVKGYAVGGQSGQVSKVEVSIDEGRTWQPAMIIYQDGPWSWTLWEACIRLATRPDQLHGKVYSRAIDVSGKVQLQDTDWNLRGVCYSAFGEERF